MTRGSFQLRYDEDLLEAVVFLCASGGQPGLPALQIARFHREREKLYRLLDPDERNTAFFRLHLEWFREWGLEALFTGPLQEYPLLASALAAFALRRARGKSDEGAELFVQAGAGVEPVPSAAASSRLPAQPAVSPARTAVVALRPERFAHDGRLGDFLRHEFTHLQDMLDAAFGYVPELAQAGPNPAQQRLARERYRLLWDITVDGRLTMAGHTPSSTREEHWTAFRRAHAFFPLDRQQMLFDALWANPRPRHADLAGLASDPRGLRDARRPVPGASCPLCGFPTFDWVSSVGVGGELTGFIQSEFPHWTPEQGLCGRCHEVYLVAWRAGTSRPAGNSSPTAAVPPAGPE